LKPTDRVLDVDSTLAGENVRMGIDMSALQHIISVLTDLYSDPELAVIREYSTNALDAHRDAGNPLPIEVTLPTSLAPFFRVRDYGDGLDAEDIRNIYSRYGTSTKRESNDVVGMLGLGCKSALTYCDQFTLIGTKDGRTVQVSVSRDEDGGGSMTIVSDEYTPDAASGVEVVIPSRRDNDFDEKAIDFFRFWTPGAVLVNGAQPAYIGDEPELTWLVQDKLAVIPVPTNRYRVESPGWIVMGNVAYPMPSDGDMYGRKYRIVAFVDIGEVNFTPSREALHLTGRTKATLAKIAEDVKRELTAAMRRKITQATSPLAAILAAQQAERSGVKVTDLTFKGKPVPDTLRREYRARPGGVSSAADSPKPYVSVLITGRHAKRNGEQLRAITAYAEGRAYFTNFAAQEFSTAKRQKLEVWLETDEGKAEFPDGGPSSLVCVDALTPDELFWTQGTKVLDWTPVQAIKVVRAGTVGPSWQSRPNGSYELERGGHIEAKDIDLTVPLLWLRTNERYDQRGQRQAQIPADALVLVMPVNRREKFQRDFPHAMHWRDYVKKEATDWLDQQDAALVEAAKYRISGAGENLQGLDPTRIDDPELAKWVRIQNMPNGTVQSGLEKRASYLGIDKYVLRNKFTDPTKNYPLVPGRYANTKHAEHVYLYLNAAYAADRSKS
jgi:hypothetical protein